MSIFTKLPKGISRPIGKVLLTGRKYSPEVLTVVGVAGVVASTVLIARATLKVAPVVAELKGDTGALAAARTDENAKEVNQQIVRRYAAGTLDIAKVYAPSVTLGLASLGCILGAHGIMRRRNVALAAAYKAVESSFSEYKKRVVAELGEEKAQEIARGQVTEEITKEDGSKEIITRVDPHQTSLYARVFAKESSTQWEPEAVYNLMFLRTQQSYFNDLLQTRGYVFLNEVYKALGFEQTRYGQVVGWVLSENGDNYVDFGIYDATTQEKRMFINGDERSVWLDFNVSGNILNRALEDK